MKSCAGSSHPERTRFEVTFFEHQLPVFDSSARQVVYVKGRRAGGTHGAVNRLLEIAHSPPPTRQLWVDTIHRNIGRYVRRYFLPGLRGTHYRWDARQLALTFEPGSLCDFGSAQKPENLEGFAYDVIWVNEAGTVLRDEALYYHTLLPMVLENPAAQLFIIGSPKGGGLFQRMYNWGRDELKEDWSSFHHTSFVNPNLDRQALEGLREFMPDRVYRQEVLAEFSEDEGAVFRNVEAAARASPVLKPDPAVLYVLGVDLARYGDYTVIWVGRADSLAAIECDRFARIPWTLQVERIAAISERFGRGPIFVDATGVGDPVCEEMARAGLPVQPIVLSAPKKQQLIDHLAIGLEQGRLTMIPHEETLRELRAYEHRLLPSGHVRLEGGKGQNDDCVVALALCYWGMNTRGSDFILGSKLVSSEMDE